MDHALECRKNLHSEKMSMQEIPSVLFVACSQPLLGELGWKGLWRVSYCSSAVPHYTEEGPWWSGSVYSFLSQFAVL